MAKKFIGIEIGSDTLKLAAVSNGAVVKTAVKRLRKGSVLDGRIASVSDMAATIKETMKENGIRPGVCAFVLPPQFVIGRSLTMPAMSEAEYMLNLPFEFRDFIGKDADKYLYDYAVRSVNGNTAELYACAVLKSDADVYYDLAHRAGLRLKALIPPEAAWLNLIRGTKNVPANLCVVDIGFSSTSVDIFSEGGFIMGKEIEFAGQAIDETLGRFLGMDSFAARMRKEANMNNCITADCCTDIYADIATEVSRIIKYYNDVHKEAPVRDVYYCGGSSLIEPLRTAIIKASDMTPHRITRLLNAPDGNEELLAVCAIAAGAAIQL